MAGKYHGLGRYGPTTVKPLDRPTHHISLNGQLSGKMANTAIWHELTHAKQCERFLPETDDVDEAARTANAALATAFRQEMKDIRRKKNTFSKKVTIDYMDVSFEVEARQSDKDFAVKDNIVTSAVNDLTDDKGRYRWRVDVWKKGARRYGKNQKQDLTFVGTQYVVATGETGAKTFAREQYKLSSFDSFVVAHQTYPTGG